MAISYVSSVSAGSSNGSSVTTGTVDTTGADFLVAAVAFAAGASPSMSDNKGNTWTALSTYSSTYSSVKLYYSIPTSVGTGHTFTVSSGASSYPAVAVSAYFGVAGTPIDQTSGAAADAVTSLATGSVTPSQDDELLITAVGSIPTPNITGVDSGFTQRRTVQPTANNGGVSIADLIQGAAAAKNPTWSLALTTYPAVAIATFKAAPPVIGSGTEGRLAKFTATNKIGDSAITTDKAPVTIISNPDSAAAATAAVLFSEISTDHPAGTPAAGDLVAIYNYSQSKSGATYTGVWAHNAVVHAKYSEVGLSGIEIDLQNEVQDASEIPFQSQAPSTVSISSSSAANPTVITTSANHGLTSNDLVLIAGHSVSTVNGLWRPTVMSATTFSIPVSVASGGSGGTAGKARPSKTGIASVLGPGGFSGTAAFAATVNSGSTSWAWKYGYWSAGCRVGYHVSSAINGGTITPDVAFSNDSNATALLKSTGTHTKIIDAAPVFLAKDALQIGTQDLGSAAGPRVEVGYNNGGSSQAAGCLLLYSKSGQAYYLWVDASGKLRISTTAPTGSGSVSDTSGTVVGTQS